VTLSLGWLGTWMAGAVSGRMAEGLRRVSDGARNDITPQALSAIVWPDLGLLAAVAGPPAAIAVAVTLGSSVLQAGWTFAPKALELKWNRLSPSSGFARFAPLQAGGDLVKALLGLSVLVAVCYSLVSDLYSRAPGLTAMSPAEIGAYAWDRLWSLLWRAGLALAVVAGADYGLQYWRWISQQRMTRQEVKDEYRANEGNPEIKARVRRIQREMTRRRMLHAVKDATVVITNPTHFAVALRYRRSEMSAPVVVAKGQDLMAARIRKVAVAHGVPCVENVVLARALYKDAEIGDAIPGPLFGAVAEVLAYLVRLKQIVL
jgi:flagellar biosynthetic protein FlhB